MKKMIKENWKFNANICEEYYGVFVDWDEQFYTCPECGEPIYACDWTEKELEEVICPVCGYMDEDE